MLGAALKRIFSRPPDFIIGGRENPYIRRWWIIPRNPIFNIYLHNMLRDDDDRALHDHSWWNISIILSGGYLEHMPVSPGLYPYDHRVTAKMRKRGNVVFRRARHAHRLTLMRNGEDRSGVWRLTLPSWSLFITGPRLREWGFWCSGTKGWRWVPWQEFTDPTDKGKTGKGCAE